MLAGYDAEWRLYLASHLRYNKVSEDDSYIIETDVEAHTPLNITHGSCYDSLDASNRNHPHEYLNIQDTREDSLQHYPTTLSLLKFRTILIGASSILWINVSWTAIEPLLPAKRLDSLHGVGKKGIGVIFSLSSIIYVPSVFLVQYLPRHVPYNIIIDYANTDCSATYGCQITPFCFGWDYIAWYITNTSLGTATALDSGGIYNIIS